MLQGFSTNVGVDKVDADRRAFLRKEADMLTAVACLQVESQELWGMHFKPVKVI